jgi:hypothetical protein
MTDSHDSALEALDGFWSAIRNKADSDATFARDLVSALAIPIQFKIEPPLDATAFKAVHAFISPRVLVDQGEDKFRELFSALTDAQKKTVIKTNNYASAEALQKKRGVALIDILWSAASAQAERMASR